MNNEDPLTINYLLNTTFSEILAHAFREGVFTGYKTPDNEKNTIIGAERLSKDYYFFMQELKTGIYYK